MRPSLISQLFGKHVAFRFEFYLYSFTSHQGSRRSSGLPWSTVILQCSWSVCPLLCWCIIGLKFPNFAFGRFLDCSVSILLRSLSSRFVEHSVALTPHKFSIAVCMNWLSSALCHFTHTCCWQGLLVRFSYFISQHPACWRRPRHNGVTPLSSTAHCRIHWRCTAHALSSF